MGHYRWRKRDGAHPTPKFIRKRLTAADAAVESNGGIGSSDPVSFDHRAHGTA